MAVDTGKQNISDWGEAWLRKQMNQTCKVSMPDPDSVPG
jgi:hypothetical protein